jgi:phage FluMu protein Com
MSIWFNCKKCGEALAAAEKKAGNRVACPKCHAKNKIPGIAMQTQVTKEQIEQMQITLNRHKHSLWVLFILLFFGIGILSTMLMDSNVETKVAGLVVFFFGLGSIIISLFTAGPTSWMVGALVLSFFSSLSEY